MAFLREITTERTVPLEPEHSIGRAQTCSLHLESDYVSAQHALLRYDGEAWLLRDLASLNGTWLNDRRIPAGLEQRLGKGARIAFGSQGSAWELFEDSPPAVMVVPIDESDPPVLIEGDLLALPSAEDPKAMIYRGPGNSWMLEEGDALPLPLSNLRVFRCGGRAWRFSCPTSVRATTRADSVPNKVSLRNLTLEFSVSLDEEHVEIRARGDRCVFDLGERAHHYLLLTLARRRLADDRNAVPETAAGWVDLETLCRNSSVTRSQVNVEVFRIRQQFIDSGVVDGPNIVERRPGQLRIGNGRVTVSRR